MSKGKIWGGRIMSGLPALMLLVDGVTKIFKPAPVVEGTVKLGYSESVIVPLGIVLFMLAFVHVGGALYYSFMK